MRFKKEKIPGRKTKRKKNWAGERVRESDRKYLGKKGGNIKGEKRIARKTKMTL
jgi:hypothetical protein